MCWLCFHTLNLSPPSSSCLEPDCFNLLFALKCPSVLHFLKHRTPCKPDAANLALLAWCTFRPHGEWRNHFFNVTVWYCTQNRDKWSGHTILADCVGIHTATSAAVSAADTPNTPDLLSSCLTALLWIAHTHEVVGQTLISTYMNNQIDKWCVYRLFIRGRSTRKTSAWIYTL